MPTATATAKLIAKLVEIPGIGPARAKKIAKKIKKVSELAAHPDLINKETRLFLRMQPLRKIPHKDITALAPALRKIAKVAGVKAQIVGSYRRNTKTSRDIDVMIECKLARKRSSCTCLADYIAAFRRQCQLVVYNGGSDKTSFFAVVSQIKGRRQTRGRLVYKIDVFHVAVKNELIPMLLYATGNKHNNLRMRSAAKRQGMLLNQHGLFKRGKTGKLTRITRGLRTEADYYRVLGLTYLSPTSRSLS